jgi:hypothetical protein
MIPADAVVVAGISAAASIGLLAHCGAEAVLYAPP